MTRLALGMARTATLDKTYKLINICHKLCLIVLFLYGIAWLNQHSDTDAPTQKIFDLLGLALVPKAYPISLPDLRPSVESYSTDSDLESIDLLLPMRGDLPDK
jgi:hypothetical protein